MTPLAARLFSPRIMPTNARLLTVGKRRTLLARLPFDVHTAALPCARMCSPGPAVPATHASIRGLALRSDPLCGHLKNIASYKRYNRTLLRTRPAASARRIATGTATALQIELVPCLSDNYSFLIHDPEAGITAAVDPAEAKPFEDILESRGLQLNYILSTHHHLDHVGGNEALKQKYGATVVGPLADKDRIPGIDTALADGDTFQLGGHTLTVYDTPGHTRGHIIYWCPSAEAVFVGDTLFALGCGRLLEGTPAQMFKSLAKIKALPGNTKVYCAHEYTQANARFCLSRPKTSPALLARAQEITRLRDSNVATVPSTVQLELDTNPFLRAATVEEFAELRKAKDTF